ncbi:MAG: glycosyltransferase family 1 protein [Thiobacillus sp.]|nr:glycosyltransferase family 1 protein [Thiobacillus sp.]
MRVLFDAFELAPGAGKSIGIYNYALNLFRALLQQLPSDIELVVVCNPACAADFDPGIHPRVRRIVLGTRNPGRVVRQLWLRWGALREVRRNKADTYFSPKGFLPGFVGRVRGVRTVVVLHDLIPLWYAEHHSGFFGFLEERLVNGGLRRTARKADRIVAISRATADDIASRTKRTRDVSVVHNGLPLVAPGPRLLTGDYLFAITSSLPHKNATGVLAAYRAYRLLVSVPLPLLVCGIADPGLEGVHAVRGLSDAELHSCYAHARAFLFLSRIEGFGFPPLEAMTHGVPVVCADVSALREVTQGAAVLVDPDDAVGAGAALRDMATDSPERERVVKLGQSVVASYSWERCARGVLAVLCE